MKSIDTRLAEVLNYLYETNGISSEKIEEGSNNRLFFKNGNEITNIKETIAYLKDYAKMMAVAESLDTTTAENHIEEAKESLEQKIAELKDEFTKVPAKKSKRIKKSDLFGYEDAIYESKLRKIEDFNNSIDERKQSIKSEIKSLQSKIKELDSMKKDLGNPTKMMNRLFEEEKYDSLSNYSRLVNICASTLTEGFMGNELVGEDRIFTYDQTNKQYSINKSNFKKYVSAIKKKSDIIALNNYYMSQKYYEKLVEKYDNTNELYKTHEKILGYAGNETFKYIHDEINNIIDENNKLRSTEFKDREGNRFKRAFRSLLSSIGLSELANRPSRKVLKQRDQLKEKMGEFFTKVEADKKTKEMYEDYIKVRQSIAGQEELSTDNLHNAYKNLDGFFVRVSLPQDNWSFDDYMSMINPKKDVIQKNLNKLDEEKLQEEEKLQNMKDGLSKNAKKIDETYGRSIVQDIANKYYNLDTDGSSKNRIRKSNLNERSVLSKSTALMILERLTQNKKNISYEDLCETYANALGKNSIEEGKIDLAETIESKVQQLHDQIEQYFVKDKEEKNLVDDIETKNSIKPVPIFKDENKDKDDEEEYRSNVEIDEE